MKISAYKFLSDFEKRIEGHVFQDKNILWFRRSVYLLLLLKMLFIWPEIAMFYRHAVSTGLGSLMPQELMFLPLFHNYYRLYWMLLFAIVAFALCCKGNRWMSVVVFIISLNYLLLVTKTVNSGDKLLNFFIFMLVFVREGAIKHSVNQMLNNAALVILQLHFCLLYFLNALGKIIYPFWRNGSFFSEVWHLSYYANPNFIPHWFFNPALYFVTAWAVMLFEFTFPVLIWFKSFKNTLFVIGLLFHLGIAILLSLPDFGLVMVTGYILFFDFKQKTDKYFTVSSSAI